MALVHGIVSVKFEDAAGVPASLPVNFVADGATATLSELLTAAGTIVNKVHAISDDAITGCDITIITEITDTITAGARTILGVNVAMETSAPSRDWTLWVPSLKPALVVAGKVVIASGAIFDFAAELVSPTGSLTWETPYLNAFTALESAAKSERKLRGLDRKKSQSDNPV